MNALIAYHGFRREDFVTVRASEPSLCDNRTYPKSFYRRFLRTRYVDRVPGNAVVLWMEGMDVCGEAPDPHDAISYLREIQQWMDKKFIPEIGRES